MTFSLFAQEAAQQAAPIVQVVHKEAWEKYLDYGGWVVIAVACLSLMYKLCNALIDKIPIVVTRAVEFINSVDDRQERLTQTMTKNTENQSSLVSLHQQSNTTVGQLADAIKAKLDPVGKAFKNHYFSAARVEEFLSLSLDALQDFVKSAPPDVQVDWKRHIDAMRKSLDREQDKQH